MLQDNRLHRAGFATAKVLTHFRHAKARLFQTSLEFLIRDTATRLARTAGTTMRNPRSVILHLGCAVRHAQPQRRIFRIGLATER